MNGTWPFRHHLEAREAAVAVAAADLAVQVVASKVASAVRANALALGPVGVLDAGALPARRLQPWLPARAACVEAPRQQVMALAK